MKKWFLVLGMITCLLGLTACSTEQKEKAEKTGSTQFVSDEEASAFVDQMIEFLNTYAAQDISGQLPEGSWEGAAVQSWTAALKEMGGYQEITGKTIQIGETEGSIYVDVKGKERNAKMSIYLDTTSIKEVTVDVQYSLGEQLTNAALNTVLGMGTTFTILILISLIIAAMSLIPKLQGGKDKKSGQKEMTCQAMDQTFAQIIEKEELAGDRELIAVITAAIAASEGAAPVEGFRVRSIRRTNSRKWKQA